MLWNVLQEVNLYSMALNSLQSELFLFNPTVHAPAFPGIQTCWGGWSGFSPPSMALLGCSQHFLGFLQQRNLGPILLITASFPSSEHSLSNTRSRNSLQELQSRQLLLTGGTKHRFFSSLPQFLCPSHTVFFLLLEPHWKSASSCCCVLAAVPGCESWHSWPCCTHEPFWRNVTTSSTPQNENPA